MDKSAEEILAIADQPEPPIIAKAMVTILYDEIIETQRRSEKFRIDLTEGVSAGNSMYIAVANMHWLGTREQLTTLYRLWNRYTGEEFMP